MIRWLVLLTLCALTLSACVARKPGPINPKVAKTFKYPPAWNPPSWIIGFPDNAAGSTISNMALTVDQDTSNNNRTIWRLAFDTSNKNWDTDRGMWQGRIIVSLRLVDDSPVPLPDAQ